jgi:hypothetical protein
LVDDSSSALVFSLAVLRLPKKGQASFALELERSAFKTTAREHSSRRLLALDLLPSDARSAKALSELYIDALQSDQDRGAPGPDVLSLAELLQNWPDEFQGN